MWGVDWWLRGEVKGLDMVLNTSSLKGNCPLSSFCPSVFYLYPAFIHTQRWTQLVLRVSVRHCSLCFVFYIVSLIHNLFSLPIVLFTVNVFVSLKVNCGCCAFDWRSPTNGSSVHFSCTSPCTDVCLIAPAPHRLGALLHLRLVTFLLHLWLYSKLPFGVSAPEEKLERLLRVAGNINRMRPGLSSTGTNPLWQLFTSDSLWFALG